MGKTRLVVPEGLACMALREFLQKECGFSTTLWKKLRRSGTFSLNGLPANAARTRIKSGDELCWHLAEESRIASENIPLDILYEDADIIVVNKARGMVVHPAAGIYTGTLVNALLWHCHDLSGINGALRPGIVHRLDKDTSGVMVAAKNDMAHHYLARQIRDKDARREYRAIVHGNIVPRAGVITGDIGRHPTDRKKMAIVRENGKPATTHFEVLERFGSYTYVSCRLETGRTHQIRVHMTSIGHPLVGDPKYTAKKNPFAIVGQALHSLSLSLTHPRTGTEMTFTAPLPADMEEILHTLHSGR